MGILIEEIEAGIAAAQAAMPDITDIDEHDMRMRTLFRKPEDDLAAQINSCQEEIRGLRSKLQDLLVATYLGGVNPVLQRRFLDAINSGERGAQPLSAAAFHERFRSHAATLTAGEQIRALLASQPARAASVEIYPR